MDHGTKQVIMFILGGLYVGSLWLAMAVKNVYFYVAFMVASIFLIAVTIARLVINW